MLGPLAAGIIEQYRVHRVHLPLHLPVVLQLKFSYMTILGTFLSYIGSDLNVCPLVVIPPAHKVLLEKNPTFINAPREHKKDYYEWADSFREVRERVAGSEIPDNNLSCDWMVFLC